MEEVSENPMAAADRLRSAGSGARPARGSRSGRDLDRLEAEGGGRTSFAGHRVLRTEDAAGVALQAPEKLDVAGGLRAGKVKD
ncbi:hypothetical protein M6B38_102240 [Iris pallida]|uniref:Uncharacterized protein n=1 Tax=Iris pallida TaxID=29817 RepID=A0AAX6IM13_IRIPA|nr:hypothetical protein M6B38_327235 [Iris pallida]KAJ6854279.1 hypothetical protein M6B38_102240 [Iris pallida]